MQASLTACTPIYARFQKERENGELSSFLISERSKLVRAELLQRTA